MTAEPAFLIAALRRALNVETALQDGDNIDWTVLLRLADAHAVIPILDIALRDLSLPDNVAKELHTAVKRSAGWSLAQSAELVRLADLLDRNGIPFVAVKGPLLNAYLYGDLSVRSSGDIDLFVKRETVPQIQDILASSRYRMTSTLHWN